MTVVSDLRADPRIAICLCILTLAPPFFAATTFHRTYTPTGYLGFAVPILAAEAIIVLMAIASGMRPTSALLRLSAASRLAVLVWLIAITFVAFVTAPFPRNAQFFVLVMLLHGLFALALNERLSGSWSDKGAALLTAMGWGALLYCILTYGLLLTLRGSESFEWWHVGVGVSNVRQLAFYGLTCAGVGAGLTVLHGTSAARSERYRNVAFMAVGSGMCIWSGGRAAVGALLITFVLASALSARSERKRVARCIFAALAGGIVLSLVWLPHETYGLPRLLSSVQPVAEGINTYSSGRLAMWRDSLRAFADRPLLGYGMGQFKFLIPSALRTFTHPHNSIIQSLFQWGIVGSLAILMLLRAPLTGFWKAARAPNNSAALMAMCLLVAHVAMSMLEGNLFHVYPISVVIPALVILASVSVERPNASASG